MMIDVYTDGACSGNPGRGGWAAVIVDGGGKRSLHGSEERTTNNRMEMLAVIKGLEAVPESASVTVNSDSEYVINTMTRNWRRNANKDLWARLDAAAAARKVRWNKVPAHSGVALNEEADAMAAREAGSRGGSAQADPPAPPSPNAPRASAKALTHVADSGEARMVDVGPKNPTRRVAAAKGSVVMSAETLALIRSNSAEKGDVLGVARVAGVMGAKNTAQLIPLCHPLPLDQVTVSFELVGDPASVAITAEARTTARTGVEMEALTAVSVAALTIYDMCKSSDRRMRIEGVRLVRKSGGRSGDIELE
jgi:cyclic pyranopterin phosphate synthase